MTHILLTVAGVIAGLVAAAMHYCELVATCRCRPS
jgi:hypothetical protein